MEEEVKPIKKVRRKQSLGEEIGNAITHGCGAIFSIVATILLLVKCADTTKYFYSTSKSFIYFSGVLIFSICMLLQYLNSCLYHAFKHNSTPKKVFRLFDHISIYLLIVGTYSPVLLIYIANICNLPTIGYSFFLVQWFLAIIGILTKIFLKKNTKPFQITISMLLGWSGIYLMFPIYTHSLPLFWLILSGGLCYTLGTAFYIARFKYSHFVWHFFVLFGTILHFIAIYGFIL